jgi:hypothetical protein
MDDFEDIDWARLYAQAQADPNFWDNLREKAAEADTTRFSGDAHFIAIRDGGSIEFKIAGTPRFKRGVAFDNEADAAEHIAKAMMDTNILFMNHSSSCDFPDEFDRPDFDYDEFKDKINAIVIEAGY